MTLGKRQHMNYLRIIHLLLILTSSSLLSCKKTHSCSCQLSRELPSSDSIVIPGGDTLFFNNISDTTIVVQCDDCNKSDAQTECDAVEQVFSGLYTADCKVE